MSWELATINGQIFLILFLYIKGYLISKEQEEKQEFERDEFQNALSSFYKGLSSFMVLFLASSLRELVSIYNSGVYYDLHDALFTIFAMIMIIETAGFFYKAYVAWRTSTEQYLERDAR